MNGFIYKIKCNITNEYYIGSTLNIIRRKAEHRYFKKSSCLSKDIIKRNNYTFIILEERKINSIKQLYLIENLYIVIGWRTKNKCLNNKIAYRTNNIYKYKLKLQNKKYYKKNKNKILEHQKEYKENNKDFVNRKIKCPKCNKCLRFDSMYKHYKLVHNETFKKSLMYSI